MIRNISSRLTFIYKWVFPSMWIIGFGAETIAMFFPSNGPVADRFLFLIMWVFGSVLIWWLSRGFKYVRMDNKFLYFSNYFKEVRVGLREIKNISDNRLMSPETITIHFRKKTKFGSSIAFMPKVRFFQYFSFHPIVGEIDKAVKRARR